MTFWDLMEVWAECQPDWCRLSTNWGVWSVGPEGKTADLQELGDFDGDLSQLSDRTELAHLLDALLMAIAIHGAYFQLLNRAGEVAATVLDAEVAFTEVDKEPAIALLKAWVKFLEKTKPQEAAA